MPISPEKQAIFDRLLKEKTAHNAASDIPALSESSTSSSSSKPISNDQNRLMDRAAVNNDAGDITNIVPNIGVGMIKPVVGAAQLVNPKGKVPFTDTSLEDVAKAADTVGSKDSFSKVGQFGGEVATWLLGDKGVTKVVSGASKIPALTKAGEIISKATAPVRSWLGGLGSQATKEGTQAVAKKAIKTMAAGAGSGALQPVSGGTEEELRKKQVANITTGAILAPIVDLVGTTAMKAPAFTNEAYKTIKVKLFKSEKSAFDNLATDFYNTQKYINSQLAARGAKEGVDASGAIANIDDFLAKIKELNARNGTNITVPTEVLAQSPYFTAYLAKAGKLDDFVNLVGEGQNAEGIRKILDNATANLPANARKDLETVTAKLLSAKKDPIQNQMDDIISKGEATKEDAVSMTSKLLGADVTTIESQQKLLQSQLDNYVTNPKGAITTKAGEDATDQFANIVNAINKLDETKNTLYKNVDNLMSGQVIPKSSITDDLAKGVGFTENSPPPQIIANTIEQLNPGFLRKEGEFYTYKDITSALNQTKTELRSAYNSPNRDFSRINQLSTAKSFLETKRDEMITSAGESNPAIKQAYDDAQKFYKDTYAPTIKDDKLFPSATDPNLANTKQQGSLDVLRGKLQAGDKNLSPATYIPENFALKGQGGSEAVQPLLKLEQAVPGFSAEQAVRSTVVNDLQAAYASGGLKAAQKIKDEYAGVLSKFPALSKDVDGFLAKPTSIQADLDRLKYVSENSDKMLKELRDNIEKDTQEQVAILQAKIKDIDNSTLGSFSDELGRDSRSAITTRINDPVKMKATIDALEGNPEGLDALRGMYKNELSAQMFDTAGGATDVTNKALIKNLSNIDSNQRQSFDLLFGDKAYDDVRQTFELLGNSRKVGDIKMALSTSNDPAEQAAGELLGILTGVVSPSESTRISTFLNGYGKEVYQNVLGKLRADPEYAKKFLKAVQAKDGKGILDAVASKVKELKPAFTAVAAGNLAADYNTTPAKLNIPTPATKGDINKLPIEQQMQELVRQKKSQQTIAPPPTSQVPSNDLDKIAEKHGIPKGYLDKLKGAESAGDANARPIDPKTGKPLSSASGHFQFIDKTWKEMVEKYGKKHNVTLEMKNNPKAQAIMAGYLTKENNDSLKEFLNRSPSEGELYMAHVLGKEGAKRLMRNIRNRNAVALLPTAANVNKSIFYLKNPKTGAILRPRTAKEVYYELSRRISKRST